MGSRITIKTPLHIICVPSKLALTIGNDLCIIRIAATGYCGRRFVRIVSDTTYIFIPY